MKTRTKRMASLGGEGLEGRALLSGAGEARADNHGHAVLRRDGIQQNSLDATFANELFDGICRGLTWSPNSSASRAGAR